MSCPRAMFLCVWLCGVGCTGDEPVASSEPVAIALSADWIVGGTDPMPDHRPETVACEEPLSVEPLSGLETLEIDLTRCNYVVATAPTRVALEAGDEVRVRFVHFQLVGTRGGDSAHVLLTLGATPLWERTIPLPAASASFEDVVVLDAGAAIGTPLMLHVHNHGLNTYHLVDLTRL